MPRRVPVTFEPSGATAWVPAGTTVLDAGAVAGVMIPAPCGARGVCGSCGVKIRSGYLGEPDADELAALRRAPKDVRLACRATVVGPVTVKPIISYSRQVTAHHAGEVVPLLIAVDLGTTNVAAVLIHAQSGRELARSATPNLQQAFGSDVLSRVSAALDGRSEALRAAAEESVLAALTDAAAEAGVSLAGSRRIVVAGNPAMSALLLGVDVSSLAAHPFDPPYGGCKRLPRGGAVMGALPEDVESCIIPPAAGFVGGDALGGALSHGLLEQGAPTTMLIDVGTNAEIVLAHDGVIHVGSAAAGPAFEGAGVTCGGAAASGAVYAVEIEADGRPHLSTLGDAPPSHFTGSGLLSALGVLREVGLLGASGLMGVGKAGGITVRPDDEGVLQTSFRPGEGGCLHISQRDVRSLQLAKAAIASGIRMVLRSAHIAPGDVQRVLLAGAFGRAARERDLLSLGVLPAQFAGRIEAVGNSSLDGASAVAFDPARCSDLLAAIDTVQHVDLAGAPEFQRTLIEALSLEPMVE